MTTRSGRSRQVVHMRRVFSPRGALALHNVDGALSFAVRASLAMALPAVPIALAGWADQAVYAMLGSFTTTFGRNLPYARRARVLALVALAMTACVGCGSALSAWVQPQSGGAGAAVVVAATAVVAGLAKLACDAARLSGLGAVLLLFSFAVSANGAPTPADVLPETVLAASGAVVAWVLSVLGWFVHPDRPQRLAVAAALRELAGLLDATVTSEDMTRPLRHRATAAVLEAHWTLGLLPAAAAERGRRGGICVRLTDLSWSLLISSARRPPELPADLAVHLRDQAGMLVRRRRHEPRILAELTLTWPMTVTQAGALFSEHTELAGTRPGTEQRAAELVIGRRRDGSAHASGSVVPLVPALRMVVGTGLAGGAALLLGLGHGYWAAISAAAVLHSINVRTAAQRAVQRTLGTAAGLGLALGVLALSPAPLTLVLVIVFLEFLLEYCVARNYGLGVVFLTPLALLLSELAAPIPPEDLVQDRALSSMVGIVVALACALVMIHGHAAARVERALAACTAAAECAEQALEASAEASFPQLQSHLAAAVVELREADDAATGELWPSEIDPTELAVAEQRAYRLLERLEGGHPGW
ncbi:FUSC family protein [Streptomyces sp. NPDC048441]|uniref:FUSC family protein n=1 Tax=Streptomyces sp. NPDC048441 TaxID=3365552 RepID=UPI0037166663